MIWDRAVRATGESARFAYEAVNHKDTLHTLFRALTGLYALCCAQQKLMYLGGRRDGEACWSLFYMDTRVGSVRQRPASSH